MASCHVLTLLTFQTSAALASALNLTVCFCVLVAWLQWYLRGTLPWNLPRGKSSCTLNMSTPPFLSGYFIRIQRGGLNPQQNTALAAFVLYRGHLELLNDTKCKAFAELFGTFHFLILEEVKLFLMFTFCYFLWVTGYHQGSTWIFTGVEIWFLQNKTFSKKKNHYLSNSGGLKEREHFCVCGWINKVCLTTPGHKCFITTVPSGLLSTLKKCKGCLERNHNFIISVKVTTTRVFILLLYLNVSVKRATIFAVVKLRATPNGTEGDRTRQTGTVKQHRSSDQTQLILYTVQTKIKLSKYKSTKQRLPNNNGDRTSRINLALNLTTQTWYFHLLNTAKVWVAMVTGKRNIRLAYSEYGGLIWKRNTGTSH